MLKGEVLRNFLSALTIVLTVGGSFLGWTNSVNKAVDTLTLQVASLAKSFQEFKCEVHPNTYNCRLEDLAGLK